MNTPKQDLPFWTWWGAVELPAPAQNPGKPRRDLHPALIACRMLVVLSVLTGLLYPLLVTAISAIAFPGRASGSIVLNQGQPVGSGLLAQRFASDRYLWPRPSAGDDGTSYATVPSTASNLGPTSSNLALRVCARVAWFRAAHEIPGDVTLPSEMVFASGSGLDPHISPASARMQIQRVTRARHFDATSNEQLRRLVDQFIEPPQLGFLGEPRVNVLHLNLALDRLP